MNAFTRYTLILLCIMFFGCHRHPGTEPLSPTEMVLIPAGSYQVGFGDDFSCSPVHEVIVDSFYIDICEVTNAQYAEFCRDTGRQLPDFWGIDRFHCGPEFPDHPVIGVSFWDASAFAEWRGARLPTEAEWEIAGRGGLIGYDYPSTMTIDTALANITFKGIRRGSRPVGSYAANGYGLFDMCGNVSEWVQDNYRYGYDEQVAVNPAGPEDGEFKVFRGGGWHSGPGCCRVYYRNALPSNWCDFAVGFRCVKKVGESR